MGINHVLYQATRLPSSETLFPTPAEAFFKGFLWVHDKWKWIRLGEIYSDKNKFLHIAAGEGLYRLAGKSSIVRAGALTLLIATRILHCVKEYEKLQQACKEMFYAFDNTFPPPIECDWNQETYGNTFSISTVIWIKTTTQTTIIRIQRVAIAIFHIGKHTFLLVMRLADAAESFSFSPEVKKEGVRFLFVNISDWITNLSENRGLLLEGLRSNQELIDTVLQGVDSKMDAEQLIQSIDSMIDKIEEIDQSVQDTSRTIVDFLIACCKKWGYEFLKEIGLHHLVPKSMIPPPSLVRPLPDLENYEERFPPTKDITKPKKPSVLLSSSSPMKGSNPVNTSFGNRSTLSMRTTPPASPKKK